MLGLKVFIVYAFKVPVRKTQLGSTLTMDHFDLQKAPCKMYPHLNYCISKPYSLELTRKLVKRNYIQR